MLAVDWDQLGPGHPTQRLHHRPRGDEALLVRQTETTPRRQRGHRHREPGEADDPVDHHVGLGADRTEIGDDLGLGLVGQRLGDETSGRLIRNGDGLGSELACLVHERLDAPPRRERHDAVGAGLRAHDLEGLAADGTGRAGDRDPDRAQAHGSMISAR